MRRPSSVSVTSPPRRVDLGGERGEPVGLVAAQVRDAAQVRGGVGQGGERRDHRRELAGVVQVGVDAVDLAGAASRVRPSRSRATSAPIASSMSRMWSPAWVVRCGQPGHGDPPAGHQRGREERARRSTGRARPARRAPPIGPGSTRQVSGVAVVDDDAAVAQRLDRHLDVRLARAPAGRRGARHALVVARAGQQQRGDELGRARRRRA